MGGLVILVGGAREGSVSSDLLLCSSLKSTGIKKGWKEEDTTGIAGIIRGCFGNFRTEQLKANRVYGSTWGVGNGGDGLSTFE